LGDLSALNYIKGFVDGSGPLHALDRVLTVSGHGIGEAEMWLLDRVAGCSVETVSFRLLDTQLLQFLRAAEPKDINLVFARVSELVAPYAPLAELVADPGRVPYWCEQSEAIKRCFQTERLAVYSDFPLRLPAAELYDLIYVGHDSRSLSLPAAQQLRKHLRPHGLLAIVKSAAGEGAAGGVMPRVRFADLPEVRDAKRRFGRGLEARGYQLEVGPEDGLDLSPLAGQRECIRFAVLAPATAVLLGEFILSSLY